MHPKPELQRHFSSKEFPVELLEPRVVTNHPSDIRGMYTETATNAAGTGHDSLLITIPGYHHGGASHTLSLNQDPLGNSWIWDPQGGNLTAYPVVGQPAQDSFFVGEDVFRSNNPDLHLEIKEGKYRFYLGPNVSEEKTQNCIRASQESARARSEAQTQNAVVLQSEEVEREPIPTKKQRVQMDEEEIKPSIHQKYCDPLDIRLESDAENQFILRTRLRGDFLKEALEKYGDRVKNLSLGQMSNLRPRENKKQWGMIIDAPTHKKLEQIVKDQKDRARKDGIKKPQQSVAGVAEALIWCGIYHELQNPNSPLHRVPNKPPNPIEGILPDLTSAAVFSPSAAPGSASAAENPRRDPLPPDASPGIPRVVYDLEEGDVYQSRESERGQHPGGLSPQR